MTVADELFEGPSWSGRAIRGIIILAVLGAVAAGGWWYFLRDNTKATPAAAPQEATATTGTLVNSLAATGVANTTLTNKLTFAGAGQVTKVSVALGDKVTAGQEIARLDSKDAQRKVDAAALSLQIAQLSLADLTAPPKASDVAAAQQSVASANQSVLNAQTSVLTAQNNLAKAQAGPAAADISAADAAITSAQSAIDAANRKVDSAWTGLAAAQRTYCSNSSFFYVNACFTSDLPLTSTKIDDLNGELRNPPGDKAGQTAIISAINGLLSANTAWIDAKAGVVTAQANLQTAQDKRAALFVAPNPTDITVLENAITNAQASVVSAQASVVSAQAKLDLLMAGPTALQLAQARQSVNQAQLAYDQAKDALAALVLTSPIAGTVTALGINAGDQVTAATAAATVANPEGMRIDLSVAESDISKVKVGQYGVATFDALSGSRYIVKVTTVGTTATTTQGIVTYAVQAQILRGADLQANAADIIRTVQAVAAASGTASIVTGTGAGANGGGSVASGTVTAGDNDGAGAGGSDNFGGARATAIAQGTPVAGRTPGAGGPRGAGAAAGGVAAFANAPLPTPGMNASVTLVTEVQENVLLLPTTAIKRQGRTTYVNLLKADGTTEQRTVTIGSADATNTAITSGLAEGDKVIVNTVSTATGARTATARTTPAAAGGEGGLGHAGGGGGDAAPVGGVR
ncbi:MAG: HlyD family efflux transporter periplasmic adaptor subunit [Chloroflexi bacterium]|nr:HlyD family efflux transporter periplasmic adaptor subunit [Chloroflexota bacterium]